MSAHDCERWRGAMAMDALGALPGDERTGLLAHLDGCQDCRDEARELVSTASYLRLVERSAVDQTAFVSPVLTGRVLGELHRGAAAVRRRRRTGAALAAMAVAASLVVAGVLTVPATPPPAAVRTMRLIGPHAHGVVTLAARSWGTAVTLAEPGGQTGGNYTVSMRTSAGSWWATGSYHASAGTPVDAQMTCAVPVSQITGVRVTDARGTTVLWSEAASASHWEG